MIPQIRPEDPTCLRDHADRIARVVASNACRMPVSQLDRLLEYRDHLREQARRLEDLSARLWAAAPSASHAADTVSARANCRRCGTLFPVQEPDPAGHDCPACQDASCHSCGTYGACRCWQR